MIEVVFPGQERIWSNSLLVYKEHVSFMNNELINYYLSINTVNSLTFVDSDCILPDNFRELVTDAFKNQIEPLYIQPYAVTKKIYKNKLGIDYKSFANGGPHTGLAYSYGHLLLKKMIPFPESFKLGGYDTFLYHNQLKEKDIKKGFLPIRIDTFEHGIVKNRLYNERQLLPHDQKTIDWYFKQRREDEFISGS